DDISKEATASLPQKVSKKLKAGDVLMIPNSPWFEPKDLKTLELFDILLSRDLEGLLKAEDEEKMRLVVAEELKIDFEATRQLILDMEAQQFEDDSFNHWIAEGELMVQELAEQGETFATRRIQAN
ncbi:hypothetical protein A2U01_0059874, partial [Trifolium medium]|nr:hypothetical protein [Trifolium medium]